MADARLSEPLATTSSSPPSERLLAAGLRAFAAKGFEATTTRDIATGAGMSPAGLYVHYRSKADLLFELSHAGHMAVLAAVEEALAGVEGPVDRVSAFVRASTVWHARHHTAARVIQYELGALELDRFKEIRRLRRRVERLLQAEIQSGVRLGVVEAADTRTTTRALLSLTIDVARWYRPHTDPSPERLGAAYASLARAMVTPRSSGLSSCSGSAP